MTTDATGAIALEESKKGFNIHQEWWWWPFQTNQNNFIGWHTHQKPEKVDSTENELRYRLSRVLFFDGAPATWWDRTHSNSCSAGAANCFAANTKYIAQLFIANDNYSICYFGMGIHHPIPAELAIHSDNAGLPGTKIVSRSPDGYQNTAAGNIPFELRMSNLGAASTANLCANGGSPTLLIQNQNYWIVSSFTDSLGASNSYTPNYVGSPAAPASGVALKQSADGVTWTNAPTLMNPWNSFNSLLVLVAQ